jgi:hypothetical protein
VRAAALAAILVLAPFAGASGADPKPNGFSVVDATIPVDAILAGGPPRDGIPALDHPEAIPATAAPWHDQELVIGVEQGGQFRAYPIALLNWHELVNDTLGERDILVSYCPLCGTGMVFDRKVDGKTRTFGVSGLLYQSDLLLYDRETESLWSQIGSEAVTGDAAGTRLVVLRSELTPWGSWRSKHPQTTVLGVDTGHRRDYGRSPYGDYAKNDTLFFPAPLDSRYHPKMPTLGVRVPGGAARAYPGAELARAGGRVEELFEGHRIAVTYDEKRQIFDVEAAPELEVIEGYWFAWSAFHPESTVFAVSESE